MLFLVFGSLILFLVLTFLFSFFLFCLGAIVAFHVVSCLALPIAYIMFYFGRDAFSQLWAVSAVDLQRQGRYGFFFPFWRAPHTYIHTYTYTNTRTHAHTHTRTHTRTCVCMCTHTHTHTHTNTCTHTHTQIHPCMYMYVCVYVCTYMYTCIHTHTHTHTHTGTGWATGRRS
jgi:hypothetical protein